MFSMNPYNLVKLFIVAANLVSGIFEKFYLGVLRKFVQQISFEISTCLL